MNKKRRLLRIVLLTCAVAAVLGAVALYFLYFRLSPAAVQVAPHAETATAPAAHAEYVGAKVCMHCHKDAFAAWNGSHHSLAMQEANAQTVLGNFNDAKFKYRGVESTFFQRDGKFYVRTDGADGQLADYPVTYTFGITPLQQYLIEFPGGRYQALSIAWDSRVKEQGGQRWFHLYAQENIDHNDQLHWTGRYQNWNLQCAECHSTNLKKGYDAATDTYKTIFSALNVSCEACHGPASQHIDWAQRAQPPFMQADSKGLLVQLHSRWQEAWKFAAHDAKFAQRDKPAADALMNTCWACHARRSTLAEGGVPGLPLEDTHRPVLLTQPTYYADGQQRDEDYTWGSFRQSKMYQKGVTCLDCHEPHRLKLRAEGNALCVRCHNAAVFDSNKHHFHKLGSKGAQCIDCHAPKQNYMVIDGRHDHSFRLPRPDLSLSLASPNACTQCHQDRKPEWAAAQIDKWYGKSWRQRPHYGTLLQAGVTQGVKALPTLLQLARNPEVPAVVRATAAAVAGPSMRPEYLSEAEALLRDPDPSVRIAALGLFEAFDSNERIASVTPLLTDPVLGVRSEAGRILADAPENQLLPDQLQALHTAVRQYLTGLQQDADWPAANVNIGNLALRQGHSETAISWYKRALTLDPRFTGAYVNLADVYRQSGQEDEGEKLLRKGLNLLPNAADLHHALGLLLVRKGSLPAALDEFSAAYKFAPDNARYAYVYAIALHSAGKRHEALAVLQAADAHYPYDLDILGALINIQREMGNLKAARAYARKAAEALPNDAAIKQLSEALEASP